MNMKYNNPEPIELSFLFKMSVLAEINIYLTKLIDPWFV